MHLIHLTSREIWKRLVAYSQDHTLTGSYFSISFSQKHQRGLYDIPPVEEKQKFKMGIMIFNGHILLLLYDNTEKLRVRAS